MLLDNPQPFLNDRFWWARTVREFKFYNFETLSHNLFLVVRLLTGPHEQVTLVMLQVLNVTLIYS